MEKVLHLSVYLCYKINIHFRNQTALAGGLIVGVVLSVAQVVNVSHIAIADTLRRTLKFLPGWSSSVDTGSAQVAEFETVDLVCVICVQAYSPELFNTNR